MAELSSEQTQSWLLWGAGLLGLGGIATALVDNWAKIKSGTFSITDLIPDSWKSLLNLVTGNKPTPETPAPATPATPATTPVPVVETPVTPRVTAQRGR